MTGSVSAAAALVTKVETQFPLAVQNCEHLNRALIMERFSADAKGIVGSLHGSTLDVYTVIVQVDIFPGERQDFRTAET